MLEFTVLIIILMAVFLSMSSYIKRGIQGRWKSAVDDLGDQYDPKQTNGSAVFSTLTFSNTTITTNDVPGGSYTTRTDNSFSRELHNSYMQVGQEGDSFDTAK